RRRRDGWRVHLQSPRCGRDAWLPPGGKDNGNAQLFPIALVFNVSRPEAPLFHSRRGRTCSEEHSVMGSQALLLMTIYSLFSFAPRPVRRNAPQSVRPL